MAPTYQTDKMGFRRKPAGLSDHIYQLLTQDGTKTGTSDMSVDGSSTAVEYYIDGRDGGRYIERLLILVRDDGVWTVEEFGAIVGGITNGVRFDLKTVVSGVETVENQIDGASAIKTNGGWSRLCYDVRVDTYGNGDSFLAARWTFSRAGYPIWLSNDTQRLSVTIQDDLTSLTSMFMFAQGYRAL